MQAPETTQLSSDTPGFVPLPAGWARNRDHGSAASQRDVMAVTDAGDRPTTLEWVRVWLPVVMLLSHAHQARTQCSYTAVKIAARKPQLSERFVCNKRERRAALPLWKLQHCEPRAACHTGVAARCTGKRLHRVLARWILPFYPVAEDHGSGAARGSAQAHH